MPSLSIGPETQPASATGDESASDSASLKVAMVPYLPMNPYQDLLKKGLSPRGVEVRLFKKIGEVLADSTTSYDVVHLHWPPKFRLRHPFASFSDLAKLRKICRSGARLVWTVHNEVPHDSEFLRADLAIARKLAQWSNEIICHSEEARQSIAQIYGVKTDKISVAPHGNYIGHYQDTLSDQEAREKFGFQEEETVLVYFGLIKPYKGVLDLMNAFLKSRPVKTKLLVAGRVGTGVNQSELEALAAQSEDIVLKLGLIPEEEIQDIMHAADAAVFSYRKSLTSGALMLAMSFGRACLGYENQTTRSLIGEEGCLFVEDQDVNDLSRKITATSQLGRAKLSEMGRHNRLRAESLSWEVVAEETKEIYLSALQHAPCRKMPAQAAAN